MKIETYKTLVEKSQYFDSITIETKKDLDNFIKSWSKKDDLKKIMFRGVNEAKYKLYNSGQRAWIGNELNTLGKTYYDFIDSQITYIENYQNGLFKKFYNSFGTQTNDLSLLSYLQHYGAPTPFLDFTYNVKNALFFATYNCNHIPSNKIDNYFSIYAIEYDAPGSEFQSIIDILNDSINAVENYIEKYPEKNVENSSILNPIEKLSFKHLQQLETFYIPEYKKGGYKFKTKSFPDFKLIFNQQNLNVINQEGLFVYMFDENNPLEKYFAGNISEIQQTYRLPKIKCWNIHKSFKDYILSLLSRNKPYPINIDYIFPQEEKIAENAYNSFKISL